MSKRKIEVMFRWEPKFMDSPGYVVAILPYEPGYISEGYERSPDICTIYYSNGDGFSWSRFNASMGRKPAKPAQYEKCLKELECMGFEVEVISKVDKKRLKDELKKKPIFTLPESKTWN